jgi:Cu/Ag efflux protein CusF
MQRYSTLLALVAAAFVFASPAHAADNATKASAGNSSAAPVQPVTLSSGEVKQIDKKGGKITIKHGPLTNLDMPGMTMAFRVKNPAMLEQVKSGDRIRFLAENIDGALTVMRLERAK